MRLGINRIWAQVALSGLVVPATALAALAGACSGEVRESSEGTTLESESVSVVTTIYPLEYFASRLGGDLVEVANLVPAGVGAHDFKPTPRDIRRINAADVVIYNGAGFEPWFDRALDSLKGKNGQIVIEASLGIAEPYGETANDGVAVRTLVRDEPGQHRLDPHVWLDPLKAVEQVWSIRDGLVRADPRNEGVYRVNSARLVDDLVDLEKAYAAGLSSCDGDHFATSHDAFGYLARRFSIEAVPISGISPEVEPAPRDLARLVSRLEELGISHIMVEPAVSRRLATTVAREAGAVLLTLHPLESLTQEELSRGESYFSVMEANLSNLRVALGCGE